MRKTILPWSIWLFLILGIILPILGQGEARAEPKAKAMADGAMIVIYNERCKLLDMVENLPFRATWSEQGKTFEGCFGKHSQYPILLFYFSDKTVVVIAVHAFEHMVNS